MSDAPRPRHLVRFPDPDDYEAACSRLRTFDDLEHPGWHDPQHLFLVMELAGDLLVLCPVSSSPAASPNGFDLPRLGTGEGNIITHPTYLHSDLAVLADPADVEIATHPRLPTLRGEIQNADFQNRMLPSYRQYFAGGIAHLPPPA